MDRPSTDDFELLGNLHVARFPEEDKRRIGIFASVEHATLVGHSGYTLLSTGATVQEALDGLNTHRAARHLRSGWLDRPIGEDSSLDDLEDTLVGGDSE